VINRIGFRAGVACIAALSAGLSIAIISLSKVVLVFGAVVVLLKGEQQFTGKSALQGLWHCVIHKSKTLCKSITYKRHKIEQWDRCGLRESL
jgi:hypothetical protein